MRVFMTGATGFIGSAVASALVNAGHEVTAVVRSGSRRTALEGAGIRLVEGSLQTLGTLETLVAEHDGFVHAASADGADGPDLDAAALDVFLSAGRSGRIFVYTSGVWVLGNTGNTTVDESSPTNPLPLVSWREGHERRVLDAAEDDFVTAVIRPGCVYGGSQSLLANWFAAAAAGRNVEIIGSGANRWAMVYLDDVADCFLRALELRSGGVFHAVDDSRSTLLEVATTIVESGAKGSRIEFADVDEARRTMGPFADALAVDQCVSSRQTRDALGWEPSCESIVASIERQWAEWRESSGAD